MRRLYSLMSVYHHSSLVRLLCGHVFTLPIVSVPLDVWRSLLNFDRFPLLIRILHRKVLLVYQHFLLVLHSV